MGALEVDKNLVIDEDGVAIVGGHIATDIITTIPRILKSFETSL